MSNCKIEYNEKGFPSSVRNLHTGGDSKLFLDILSSPFIETPMDALSVFLEVTSDEFLDENVEMFNGEPIVRYVSGAANAKKIFNSFDEAKSYGNGDVMIGFVPREKIIVGEDGKFIPMEDFIPFQSYSPAYSSANSPLINKSNRISGNLEGGQSIVSKVDLSKLNNEEEYNSSAIIEDNASQEDLMLMAIKRDPALLVDAMYLNGLIEKECE